MKEKLYTKADYILALLLIASAWVYMNGGRYFGEAGFPVFTGCFLLSGMVYLSMSGKKLSGEGRLYLCFTVLAGVWFLISFLPGKDAWREQDITSYMVLFLHVMGVYWVLTISGNRIDGCLNENGLRDITRGFFILPFANFVQFPKAVINFVSAQLRRSTTQNDGRQKVIKQVLIGIGVSIPVLIIVLPTLAAADESFYLFAGNFAEQCVYLLLEIKYFFSFEEILWNSVILIIGCYLFGLFYGSFHTKPPKTWEKVELPVVILLTFSTMICGVYLLFFIVKFTGAATVLFSQNRDVVYSEFARQGFFELCFISAINFCIFYGVKIFSNRENKWVKTVLSLLGVETLGFIVLAFSKMSLYISVYGFTFKRVFTSWFMSVLFFTFILLIRALHKKCNAIRPAAIFAAVTFLLLAYSNMGYWILRANVLMQVG